MRNDGGLPCVKFGPRQKESGPIRHGSTPTTSGHPCCCARNGRPAFDTSRSPCEKENDCRGVWYDTLLYDTEKQKKRLRQKKNGGEMIVSCHRIAIRTYVRRRLYWRDLEETAGCGRTRRTYNMQPRVLRQVDHEMISLSSSLRFPQPLVFRLGSPVQSFHGTRGRHDNFPFFFSASCLHNLPGNALFTLRMSSFLPRGGVIFQGGSP